jgi:hypothetical protein
MDSRRNNHNHNQPPMPYQMGGFQGYNNPVSMNNNNPYPAMSMPRVDQPQHQPSYPVGNMNIPENMVGSNPYIPSQNIQPTYEKQNTIGMVGGTMMRPPSKQIIDSSNSISEESCNSVPAINSEKVIKNKYTAEEMDALLE